jgi:ABC-type Fe3+-siderophore transport system permease subunit
VAPHIARLVTSNDSKILIPASAVIGAALVVLSDVAVRLIGGLPVGVVTALIGSPLFIYILYVQRKNASF